MVIYVLLGAVSFFILQRLAVSSLLAIILLVLMVATFAWVTFDTRSTMSKPPSVLQNDVKDRSDIVATNYSIKRFGRLNYLDQNPELKQIALNLRFTRIYDKARFSDLLIHFDKLQKTYMYILAGRYKPTQYIPIFKDLRTSSLEILYSFIMVVPQGMKHTYGVQPYKELEDSISNFNVATSTMMRVLHNYAKTNGFHVIQDHIHPFEKDRTNILP